MYKLTITKKVDMQVEKTDLESNQLAYSSLAQSVLYRPNVFEEKFTATLTDEEFQAIKKAILEVM